MEFKPLDQVPRSSRIIQLYLQLSVEEIDFYYKKYNCLIKTLVGFDPGFAWQRAGRNIVTHSFCYKMKHASAVYLQQQSVPTYIYYLAL